MSGEWIDFENISWAFFWYKIFSYKWRRQKVENFLSSFLTLFLLYVSDFFIFKIFYSLISFH